VIGGGAFAEAVQIGAGLGEVPIQGVPVLPHRVQRL